MSENTKPLQGRQLVTNPFSNGGAVTEATSGGTALMTAEVQRQLAEVQASFLMAKMNPRDMGRSADGILKECSRMSLAEVAVYTFARGGTEISGPSIRLLEAVARNMGNINFGWRCLDRKIGKTSLLQAYAIDLETNTRAERVFEVRHWRDTKKGGYAITDERDVYELEANQAARRVRACLEQIVPGDVVDMALEQVDMTLGQVEITPESLNKLLAAFAGYGVNKAMIEAKIQRTIDAISKTQLVTLRKNFAALKDGVAKAEDLFDVSLADPKASADAKEQKNPDLKSKVEKAQDKQEKASEKAKEKGAENGSVEMVEVIERTTGEVYSMPKAEWEGMFPADRPELAK